MTYFLIIIIKNDILGENQSTLLSSDTVKIEIYITENNVRIRIRIREEDGMKKTQWVCDMCGKPGKKSGVVDLWDVFDEAPKLRRVRPGWGLCQKCFEGIIDWMEKQAEEQT